VQILILGEINSSFTITFFSDYSMRRTSNYCKDEILRGKWVLSFHDILMVHVPGNDCWGQSERTLRPNSLFKCFPPSCECESRPTALKGERTRSQSTKGIYLALEGTRLYIVLMAGPDLCFICTGTCENIGNNPKHGLRSFFPGRKTQNIKCWNNSPGVVYGW